MCRGPGRIQQEIAALIAANPDDAWTTGELCGLIYYGQRSYAPTPEKKHRVAVTRALRQMERHCGGRFGSIAAAPNTASTMLAAWRAPSGNITWLDGGWTVFI